MSVIISAPHAMPVDTPGSFGFRRRINVHEHLTRFCSFPVQCRPKYVPIEKLSAPATHIVANAVSLGFTASGGEVV